MARTAVETANTLSFMYDESFGGEDMEMFRIGWAELRSLAGVPKLTDEYLADINRSLTEDNYNYALVPFNDFLVVAAQGDFSSVRQIPPRLLEQNLLDDEELEVDDEDDEVDEEDE
jgi:hypothetical protein